MKKIYYYLFLLTVLMSCSSKETTLILTPSAVSLHYDEEQTLQVAGANNNECTWTTDDAYHATVENGIIKANHIGSTKVRAKKDGKTGICEVKVNPQYFLYNEPCTQWGASKDQIKRLYGTPSQENTDALYFVLNESRGIIACYTFEDGGLKTSIVFLNMLKNTDLPYYLLERYQLVYAEDDKYLFINSMDFDKATLEVMFAFVKSSGSTAMAVAYQKADFSSSNAPSKAPKFVEQPTIPESVMYLLK